MLCGKQIDMGQLRELGKLCNHYISQFNCRV